MKHQHISYHLLSLAMVAVASCADDPLMDRPALVGDTSYIQFSPSVVSVGNQVTRSGEEKTLYDPLVLNSETDDFPLYLHTYEHRMEEDADKAATRGVPVETPDSLFIVHGSFGVDATVDGGEHYFGFEDTTPVSHSGSEFWTTKKSHRWPGDARLNFGAVAPWSQNVELDSLTFSKNSVSFSYSAQKSSGANGDAEAQPDLMVASASYTRAETKSDGYRVPLRFGHALSAIKFAVRDVLAGEVVSISINGVNGSGHCVYTADNDGNNGAFNWTKQSDPTSYTQLFNEKIVNGNFDPNDASQDRVLNSKTKEKTFMLIPQSIPDDAYIEVVIRRDNVAQGLSPEITVRGKIRSNNVTAWLPGHEYIYTISTSADNWVYVFDVTGNSENGNINDIYVWSPGKDKFKVHGNNSYFNVVSYRYKANNPDYKEILPWSATHGGSPSYQILNGRDSIYNVTGFTLSASEWIQDTHTTPLRGSGSIENETHTLNFSPHFLSTSWEGDKKMQSNLPYAGYSKENPYDLSKFGNRSRTTANCYVVDRGGWYMFPLVYGNAIVNGSTNEKAYKCQSSATDIKLLPVLVNHNGDPITSPYVSGGAKATLIWQDAYNMIEDIELVTIDNEKMIRFHIESMDLQQGNAIIALQNSGGTILWSWHIWATEHWLNDKGLPHKISGEDVDYIPNNVTGIRERGDVAISYNQPSTYYMSPYNLGWCDPKNVFYMKRKNVMKFIQYMPDGVKHSGKTDELDIIQDGETVEYRYGNNTYYQFGRKDPMVGFVDRNDNVKYNFGPHEYNIIDQGVEIKNGIQNPQTLFAGLGSKEAGDPLQDWLVNDGYSNLWNNHANVSNKINTVKNTEQDDLWCHLKTVYDPCPAGYMVPNAGIWRVVMKKESTISAVGKSGLSLDQYQNALNGEYVDQYMSKVWGKGDSKDDEAIFMVSTGHRWFSNKWTVGTPAGGNFGKTCSYAWSNRHVTSNYYSYGVAMGLDGDNTYYIGSQFTGRRAMARPVRAIREP